MKKIFITLALAVAAFAAVPANASESNSSASAIVAIKKTETVVFETSMHCNKCVAKINDNIAFEKGVTNLKVDLKTKTVKVTYDPTKTNKDKIAAAIKKLGYTCTEK